MTRKYYQIQNIYPLLKYPERMIAENKLCTMRSSWETKFVTKFLDYRNDVIEWTSENFFIPYFYPVDKQLHRYFPDFLAKMQDKDGNIFELLIEIKPYTETQKPTIPKKQSKAYIERCNTFIKNICKWEAAKKWCESEKQKGRNIRFTLITEKDFSFT